MMRYDLEDWIINVVLLLLGVLLLLLGVLIFGGLLFAVLGREPKARCVNGVTTQGRMYVTDGCVRVNDKVFCGNVTVTDGKCE
jgi:hypothetical protein